MFGFKKKGDVMLEAAAVLNAVHSAADDREDARLVANRSRNATRNADAAIGAGAAALLLANKKLRAELATWQHAQMTSCAHANAYDALVVALQKELSAATGETITSIRDRLRHVAAEQFQAEIAAAAARGIVIELPASLRPASQSPAP